MEWLSFLFNLPLVFRLQQFAACPGSRFPHLAAKPQALENKFGFPKGERMRAKHHLLTIVRLQSPALCA